MSERKFQVKDMWEGQPLTAIKAFKQQPKNRCVELLVSGVDELVASWAV